MEKETKRCCHCGRELPITQFAKSLGQKGGLQSWCRECNTTYCRERAKRINTERQNNTQSEIKFTKICGHCGRELPIERFAKDRTTKDGLQVRCKDCDKVYRDRYRKANMERRNEVARQKSLSTQKITMRMLEGYILRENEDGTLFVIGKKPEPQFKAGDVVVIERAALIFGIYDRDDREFWMVSNLFYVGGYQSKEGFSKEYNTCRLADDEEIERYKGMLKGENLMLKDGKVVRWQPTEEGEQFYTIFINYTHGSVGVYSTKKGEGFDEWDKSNIFATEELAIAKAKEIRQIFKNI